MGKYIDVQQRYGMGEAFYVSGKPSLQTKRLARLATGGSWSVRLTQYPRWMPTDDWSFEFFLGCSGATAIGLFPIMLGSTSGSTSGHVVAAVIGGIIGLAWLYLIGSGLFYVLGHIVESKARSQEYWAKKLADSPDVVRVDPYGGGVRPAVRALGDAEWFRRNADEYAPAIDEFLTRPEIVTLEKLLAEDGIEPALREESERELRRIAEGSVKEYIRVLETEKQRSELAMKELEADEKKTRQTVANQRLSEFLKTEIRTITTESEI